MNAIVIHGVINIRRSAVWHLGVADSLDQAPIVIEVLVQGQESLVNQFGRSGGAGRDQKRIVAGGEVRARIDLQFIVSTRCGDDLEPHENPGIRAEARLRLPVHRIADPEQAVSDVPSREVVVPVVSRREGGRGVVVKNHVGPRRYAAEVDEDVGPLGGRHEQRMMQLRRVRLARTGSIAPDPSQGWLEETSAGWARKPPSVPICKNDGFPVAAFLNGAFVGLPLSVQRDPIRGFVGDIELEVEEPGVAGVQQAQAIPARLDGGARERRAVDQHGVAEEFGDDGGIGKGRRC